MKFSVFLFFLIGFLVYGPSLNNGFVDYDDTRLIIENELIQEASVDTWTQIFSSYEETLYTPLLFLSYQIDYAIGGLDPFVFHIHSLIIHILTALLVSMLMNMLTEKRFVSLLAGLLFLLHPLNTELVAWASLRKDLLAGLFGVLSMVLFMKSKRSTKMYLASIFTFLLALLSKPSVITIPLLLPLLDSIQRYSWKKYIPMYIPFFLLSFVIGIVNVLNKNQTFALMDFSVVETILLSFKSAWSLLLWFFAPVKHSVMHPFTDSLSVTNPQLLLPIIFMMIVIAVAWMFRKKHAFYLYGILMYLILLLPSFRSFRRGENFGDIFFTAEHYAYLPSIGLLLIVCTALTQGLYRFSKKHVATVFTIVLLLFGYLSYSQAAVWKSTQTLFANVVREYDNAQMAHLSLGTLYMKKELPEIAIREYLQSLAILPTGKAYANLGQAYMRSGQLQEAITAFEKALSYNPLNAPVQLNVGVAQYKLGDLQNAIESFKKAAELDTQSAMPWLNIGLIHEQRGEDELAVEAFTEAFIRDPLNITTQSKIEPYQVDVYEAAILSFKMSAVMNGTSPIPWYNMGIVRELQGDRDRAKKAYMEALKRDPENINLQKKVDSF